MWERTSASCQYLSDLHINDVKLHGSLLRDVDDDQSKQFFIHYFNKIAATLDIDVVATQIDQASQWSTLQQMEVAWGQGRYLGNIGPLRNGEVPG